MSQIYQHIHVKLHGNTYIPCVYKVYVHTYVYTLAFETFVACIHAWHRDLDPRQAWLASGGPEGGWKRGAPEPADEGGAVKSLSSGLL